jgi:hypothetical protein
MIWIFQILIVSNKYILSLLFVYHAVMGYLNGFNY